MRTSVQPKYLSVIKMLFLLMAVVFVFNACKESEQSRKKILKIYNWADYIDEDLLTEFPVWYKEQTGEDVRDCVPGI